MNCDYCNPDLKLIYDKNPSFKKIMDHNKEQYQQKQQQSYYSDLSKINKNFLKISVHTINKKNPKEFKLSPQRKIILYIFSHFQPEEPQQLYKYFLYFLKYFPQQSIFYRFRPSENYYLIYINSSSSNKGKSWTNFKSLILEELHLQYLLFLEKLVLIRPSFLDKASSMIQFGAQNKFFHRKIQKHDSLKSFFQSIGKKFDQIEKLIPAQVLREEHYDESFVNAVLSPFMVCNLNFNRTTIQGQIELSSQILAKKDQKPKNFQYKQNFRKKGIQNYSTGQLGIPLALQLMIFYFTHKPVRCQTQGVFRKCTSIDEEKQLLKELEQQKYQILTSIQNEITVASTIKRFISNLQPPLIPYQNFAQLTQDSSLENIIKQVKSFALINFMTLMHLLKFLRDYIITNSKKNLMTFENLAICLAPCLMKSKMVSSKQLYLTNKSVEITKIMLQQFQQIFGDSQQQKRISKKTYDIYRKSSKIIQKSSKVNLSLDMNKEVSQIKCIEIKLFPQEFLKPLDTFLLEQNQFFIQKSENKIDLKDMIDVYQSEHPRYGIRVDFTQKSTSDIINERKLQYFRTQSRRSQSVERIPFTEREKQVIYPQSDFDPNQIFEQTIQTVPIFKQIIQKIPIDDQKMQTTPSQKQQQQINSKPISQNIDQNRTQY